MELITDLTIIFAAAALILLIMDRYGHPSVPAYIIAGFLAGTLISINNENLLTFVQIGIAFLVFIFGLKYDPEGLKYTGSDVMNSTAIQLILTGSLGFLLGTLLGFDLNESFYIAVASALGSSLVGLQLTEREIYTDVLHGRLSESIHFVQDMIAFALIAVMLSTTAESAVTALIYSTLLILAAIVFRDYIFDIIAQQSGGNRELLTMLGLSLLIAFIGLTEILGISMVVGAFAAGVSASKFPYNIELLDSMGSIRDFFSAIFFVVLGALVTLPGHQVLAAAIGIAFLTVFVAPFITFLSLRAHGHDSRTSLLTGLSLDQVSELALVVAVQASVIGFISGSAFEAIVLAAAFTMMTSSYTKKYEEEIYRAFPFQREDRKSYELENHVILVGHDVQGQKIVDGLRDENTEFVVIENNPEKVTELRANGVKTVYGDVMDEISWKEAAYQNSAVIISTVPSRKVSEKILDLEKPRDKIVRAENAFEGMKMLERGASHVIIPDMAAGEKLIEHIEGLVKDEHRREELRQQHMLEMKKFLNR